MPLVIRNLQFIIIHIFAYMKILVSPLDWGLGHSTRLSALVFQLYADGNEIVLAGSGLSLQLLTADHPTLRCMQLKSFSPFFFRHLPQWIAISVQVPWFVWCIIREWWQVRKLLSAEAFDMIVSDNRYGVRNNKCKSILLTHQLSPITAMWAPEWFNKIFAWCLAQMINRFDEVWVPDISPYPNGLAGRLANPEYISTPIRTIGLLSRLKRPQTVSSEHIDHLAIISGPEPQRSLMQERIEKLFASLSGTKVICDGQHYTSPEYLAQCIAQAEHIYCRSGYSTIMDLVSLNKKATLMPTYGQAEQEYLCKRMQDFGFCHYSFI